MATAFHLAVVVPKVISPGAKAGGLYVDMHG
jgi:hypothetical protein